MHGEEPSGACGDWRGGGWQRWELVMQRPLRACTGGRCGRVARASGAAQRPRDACGWAAWTGHASPAVQALQSCPIEDTNPWCRAAGRATLSTGSTPCLLLPAQRGECEPVVPRAVVWHENPVPTKPHQKLQNKAPKQSTKTKIPNLSVRPPVALRSSVCHWSSDPVILSSFSDWLESSLWGSHGPQELTPLGLVGVSLWRPWWVGTTPLEPAHDRAC